MDIDFSAACVIKNCSNKTFLKGFCKKHYLSISKGEKFKGIDEYCVVKGCNNLRKNSKYFCSKHYARYRKHGIMTVEKGIIIGDGGVIS